MALVASVVVVVGPSVLPSAAAPGERRAAAASPSGEVPQSIRDRYLVAQPSLGPVTAVDVSGEPGQRRLLAATLQGIVNRSQARIYLLGARDYTQDKSWLDDYVSRGLIPSYDTVSLDQALATFKGEVSGYVVGDYAEPWTINTATTVAGAEGGVVITPDQIPAMQVLGLPQIADHRGLWPDAATAYEAISTQYRSKMPYQGLAIEQTDVNTPRDFFVQQGVMTVFTRPSSPDFNRVYALFDGLPTDHPVYGYISDTGDEEVTAIVKLSQMGRFLVPTDTTANLSFHIAVGASSARVPIKQDDSAVAPCSADTVNVVVSISDGDNMVVPQNYYPSADRWNSPRRGELPLGWGISPALSVLMPSIWDTYASTATDNDEIVGMMGLGYSLPSFHPDSSQFLADSAAIDRALGVQAHWSLDALLSDPKSGAWPAEDTAYAGNPGFAGFLLNYETFGGPALFNTPSGLPVLSSQRSSYDVTPAGIAQLITDLQAKAPADRPLVSFIPATVWNATYDSLADALEPLRDAGVRFLTPRQALACLPAPPPPPSTDPTTEPATTAPTTPLAPTTAGPSSSEPATDPGTTAPVVSNDGTGTTYDGTSYSAPTTSGSTYSDSTPATAVDAVPTYTG